MTVPLPQEAPDVLVLAPEDHFAVGEAQFGAPGLLAVEAIGPFTTIRAAGPLITVHDSVIDAGMGIGHHPHRFNERLFYVERGTFDHDDALNRISGHVPEGAMARFTEGRRGMIHQEWNHGDEDAEIYILVASTDPVPEETSFEVLRRDDMPVYREGPGVTTREMVGERSSFPISSDIRTFTDSRLDEGVELDWTIEAAEGGLLSVREGSISLDGRSMARRSTAVIPPKERARTLRLTGGPARVIRATYGPGHGFVTAG